MEVESCFLLCIMVVRVFTLFVLAYCVSKRGAYQLTARPKLSMVFEPQLLIFKIYVLESLCGLINNAFLS